MARSTAEMSSRDQVAGVDVSRCLSKVAIRPAIVKGRGSSNLCYK